MEDAFPFLNGWFSGSMFLVPFKPRRFMWQTSVARPPQPLKRPGSEVFGGDFMEFPDVFSNKIKQELHGEWLKEQYPTINKVLVCTEFNRSLIINVVWSLKCDRRFWKRLFEESEGVHCFVTFSFTRHLLPNHFYQLVFQKVMHHE